MHKIDLTAYKVANPIAADGQGVKDLESIRRLYDRLVTLPEFSADGELFHLKRVIEDMQANLASEIPYDVRSSLIEVLFAPNQGLTARDILDRDDLARKIRDWPGEELLLEDTQFDKVKQAAESVKGFSRNDVEFVRRILNAQKVELQEKSQGGTDK